ncbi:hypothetical protein BD779DRAFT_720275 [Infundibulicybe gibba]|nr:hypothetical protein BD779DRAFT_720275 [Infundibulicybe gibba]
MGRWWGDDPGAYPNFEAVQILYTGGRTLTRTLVWQLQDTAEGFRDDPQFRALLQAINDILTSGSTKSQSIFDLMTIHDSDSLDGPSKQFYFLDAAFKFLEAYEVTHGLLLERCDFVGTLRKASECSPRSLLHQTFHNLQSRASALLEKWGPLAEGYRTRHPKWIVESWRMLVYHT